MPSLMDILNRVDEGSTIAFPLALSGNSSAAKKDRLAKISMAVPREIVNHSLQELNNWQLVIIAIPKPEYDKALSEVQKDV